MLRSVLISGMSFLTVLTCSQKTQDKTEEKTSSTATASSVNSSTTEVKSTSTATVNTQTAPTESNTKTSVTSTTKSTEPKTSGSPTSSRVKPAATTNSTVAKSASSTSSEVIYFSEGENKFIKAAEMNITFRRISEDSRCPEGTNCIWEGTAVADIELMGTYTRPVTVKLATMNNESRGYKNSVEFNGNKITLKSVTPYPTATSGSKSLQGKYKIGVVISRAAGTNNTEGIPGGTTTR